MDTTVALTRENTWNAEDDSFLLCNALIPSNETMHSPVYSLKMHAPDSEEWYSKADRRLLQHFFNHRPVYCPGTVPSCFKLQRSVRYLHQDCRNSCICVGKSTLNHAGAGEGLFATTDLPANYVVCDNYGGVVMLLPPNAGDDAFLGMRHRAISTIAQPFLRENGAGLKLYIIGSRSCAATYMNEWRPTNSFKETSCFQKKMDHSSPNCMFVETPCLEYKNGTFTSMEAFVNWLDRCPVQIVTLRKIAEGEELFVVYV